MAGRAGLVYKSGAWQPATGSVTTGEQARVGDYIQEGNLMGRVAARGILGKVPMLRLESGLYVSQRFSKVIGTPGR